MLQVIAFYSQLSYLARQERAMTDKIEASLQTTTPLFLGGAFSRPETNQNGEPELRPPTFRGALRYWLRAYLGSNTEVHRKEDAIFEDAIFGSVTDESGMGSAVNVRIRNAQIVSIASFRKDAKEPIATGPNAGKDIPTGKDYLYWSMDHTRHEGQELLARKFIAANSKFDLILQTRPTARNLPEFKYVAASLWLLLNLGGVGSRSRRTAGSLSPVRAVSFGELQFQMPAVQDSQQAAQFLGQNLALIRSWISPEGHSARPAYDVIDPQYCRIWILGVWPSGDEAVKGIGEKLRNRLRSNPDHDKVYDWLKGKPIPEIQRSVFGLPIQYRYSDHSGGMLQARLKSNPFTKFERRASPLWLRITRTADGKYVGVATLFMSQFLPVGAELYASNARPSPNPPPLSPPRDYSTIIGWIGSHAEEVQYA